MNERKQTMKDLEFNQESAVREAKKKNPGLGDIPASIISSLREGDHKAFEYVYLHYSDALTQFLTSLLQCREEAREITQEVFITLWEKRELFDPEKGLRRYIYQLAKFYALNHFDRQKVREKFEEFVRKGEVYDLAADEKMQAEETALLIEYVLQRMPERQREIFRMSREQKMSYEEIAEKLGISINTVKFHMKNALKELREMLTLFFILFIH